MTSDRIARFSALIGRIVPDAITTSIFFLVLLFTASLALGNGLGPTMDAYYRGLWMLLTFTMQMTLMLVLSSALAATPLFRKIVFGISSVPRSRAGVVALSVLLAAAMSYLNWGLSIALGPLIAIHFARQAEKNGIAIDFPFLLAVMTAAGCVWQYGISASGPLLMAAPKHFLEAETGVLPLSTTIWSPAAITLTFAFTIGLVIMACALMPKNVEPLSAFPEAHKLAEHEPIPEAPAEMDMGMSYSDRMERSRFVLPFLILALVGWIYHHFFVKELGLGLDSLITILLALCLALHGTIRNFSKAVREATLSCWQIIVLYHLYAGVAGLIQFTTVGKWFAELIASVSTKYTFPTLTAISGTVVAIFVPSSGGQWAIQGFVTTKAAEAVGVSAQRGMLALGIGDQMGNLISPFWAVVTAGIARIEFRRFFGYGLVFAALWFVLGVLAFTFLPC